MKMDFPNHFLKAIEIAEMLNVSRAHVYNLIASGDLPSVMVGKLKRVRREDLEIFVERNSINSWNQIAVK
jgi:excisionase family DNA binding protein